MLICVRSSVRRTVAHGAGQRLVGLVDRQLQLARLLLYALVVWGAAQAFAAAQPPTSHLRMAGIAVATFSRPRPGRLVTFRTTVSNPGTATESAIVLGRLEEVPGYEAAAKVHVPGGESRDVNLRIPVPAGLPDKSLINVSLSLNSAEAGQRVLLTVSGRPIVESLSLRIDSEPLVTATMLDSEPLSPPEWEWPKDLDAMSYEFVVAARVDSQLTRRTLTIGHESLPAELADWSGIDALVIARDDPLLEPAAMASLSTWLVSGGRLWIMLDKITPENLQGLLPAGAACEVIDDIELNRFTVQTHQLAPISVEDCTVDGERPVRLRRVRQTGGTVSHEIDGFPAAFWYAVGRGRLLVTTLEARGWVQPRERPREDSVERNSVYQMRLWAQSLADQFHEMVDSRTPLERVELDYPLKHIGNPVPDRALILGIVFGFCGLLALTAAWCWHIGRAVWLGWLVPLLAAVACVPIVIAAAGLRRGMVDTTAHLQLIEVHPGSRTARGLEWSGMFNSDDKERLLVAQGDAVVDWPTSAPQIDQRRWLWKDFQDWQLSSSGWPHGIWRMSSRFGLPPQQLDVVAQLDRQGLELIPPPALDQPLEDAVLCYTPGDSVVCRRLELGKTVRPDEAHLTLADSWLGDAIVDDEQARRDAVYRAVPGRAGELAYPNFPAVLGWTKLWPVPVAWSEPGDERGSALVVLPVRLMPVASGQSVSVPHSIIRVETPTIGQSRSNAFSNASGQWREETTLAMRVPIRFHLPEQVRPFEAAEIIADIQVRAPERFVTIASPLASGDGTVARFRSPLGAQRFSITDPALLADARDGNLDFTVEIGDRIGRQKDDTSAQLGPWQIDYFRISVQGRVGQREPSSTDATAAR